MKGDDPNTTRASLLSRLREAPGDPGAWEEFVARYGPRIQNWCRHWGLQEADAQDVCQSVLVLLAVKLRGFRYDPSRSFRAWLKTLTRHAWSDLTAERRRAGAVAGTGNAGTGDLLATVEARADLERCLQDAFDLELLELASARVRDRVDPKTWEAFRLTALDGCSGAEAARRLGMQVAAAFKAKSNVKKWIRDEIRILERIEAP